MTRASTVSPSTESTCAGLALILLAAAGCSSPPDIGEELEDYGDQLSSAFSLTCECHSDLGYSSIVECGEALGIVGPARRDCMAASLEGHEEPAKAYLDCANTAMVNYVLCLDDNLSEGCVEGQYFVCTNAFNAEVAGCPDLPAAVLDEFLACASS